MVLKLKICLVHLVVILVVSGSLVYATDAGKIRFRAPHSENLRKYQEV